MALTEIYVDPSIAADSGAGTVGDPYGDLEYAIEQETFDTTNGTRVNIKAGTAEVLAAQLDTALADTGTSVAWAPSGSAPLVIQGYTSTAGDGGVGVIDADGGAAIDTSRDYIHLRDLEIRNFGGNDGVTLDRYSSVVRCHIHNGTADLLRISLEGLVSECYFVSQGNNLDSCVAATGDTVTVQYCYFDCPDGAKGFGLRGGVGIRNIVNVGTASTGSACSIVGHAVIANNSFYSVTGSTGEAIDIGAASYGAIVQSNVISGWDGAGAAGIRQASGATTDVISGNSFYNCTSDTDFNGTVIYSSNNETLSGDPFTDPTNDDFSPNDTGSLKEGSLPDKIGGGFV